MKVNQSTPDIFKKIIKKLGVVEAGFASPVDEELADVMRLDDYLMRDKNASFMLAVEDDSLEHIGICENDLVIFERGADTHIGDLVIVLTDDGYKICHLSRITAGQIIGPVISVMRKYK